MKRIIIFITIISSSLCQTINGNCQTLNGTITYESSRKVEPLETSNREMSAEMAESLRKQLAAQFQRTYTLTFNNTESIWKQEAQLDPVSTGSSGGIQIRVQGDDSRTYKNISTMAYLQDSDIFGKQFLITDELEPIGWKITNEEKKIGEYTVKKALFSNIQERMTFSMSDDETETQTVTDTLTVVAWYAPEIPAPHGPLEYWGLPGLILELHDGEMSFLCTQIALNPKSGVNIDPPKKGKKVSREEADKIRDEKLQEMLENMETGGDSGSRTFIRVDG